MDPISILTLDIQATPISEPVAKAVSAFHYFLELPVELQNQIWKFSLRTPRAIFFVFLIAVQSKDDWQTLNCEVIECLEARWNIGGCEISATVVPMTVLWWRL